ncbi:MAG: glycosyltransferase family 4 protein [Maritimibacter sp.]|uniref:glycosyltransferase family 4 protein n=1 Tax=Maritimibacter sp. TaxID=2003363 RepID=UPI001DCF6644|nr:glycosyltransferase family 4 protein [Maritimibacter sp.]MBL6427646.1 glycosyltransferase family 4 protein [Maritimibacter sp.]
MRALQQKTGAVLALETCGRDLTYDWEVVTKSDKFERVTLFAREEEITARVLGPALRRTLSDWRPDLVAVPGWGDAAALYALDWAHRHSVPAILMSDSRAGDSPRSRLSEAVKQLVVRSSAGGLVAGQGHATYLQALGMDGARIATGYDVVDNAHFTNGAEVARSDPGVRGRLGLPDRYILSIGRLVPKKNLSALIAAHAAARDKRPETPDLLLVGSGPEEAALRAQAGEGVVFRGFASYADVPALIALAEGLVLASTVEQWGLVVNEAMAAGCPVLVSERAGAAELLRDGETGILTAPTVSGLTEGVQRLLDADRPALARAAQDAIGLWGPERFATGLLSLADCRPLKPLAASMLSPILRKLAARTLGAGVGA